MRLDSRRPGCAWRWSRADQRTTCANSPMNIAIKDMAYRALVDLPHTDHSFSAVASSKVVYFHTILVGGFSSIVPIPFVANSPSTV